MPSGGGGYGRLTFEDKACRLEIVGLTPAFFVCHFMKLLVQAARHLMESRNSEIVYFVRETHTGPFSPVPGPRSIFSKKVQRRVCIASTIVGDDVVIFTASVLASRWDKISSVIAEMVVSKSYALHKALSVWGVLSCLERQAVSNLPHCNHCMCMYVCFTCTCMDVSKNAW